MGMLPQRHCGQVVSLVVMGSQTPAGEAVYHRILKNSFLGLNEMKNLSAAARDVSC